VRIDNGCQLRIQADELDLLLFRRLAEAGHGLAPGQ
jgi:hypothetical protein